ncbi:MAG: hypothetical protein HW380_3586 [Magnetococcales bacterium]|nr:hypothetical protein [Magnetococcales bacterium]
MRACPWGGAGPTSSGASRSQRSKNLNRRGFYMAQESMTTSKEHIFSAMNIMPCGQKSKSKTAKGDFCPNYQEKNLGVLPQTPPRDGMIPPVLRSVLVSRIGSIPMSAEVRTACLKLRSAKWGGKSFSPTFGPVSCHGVDRSVFSNRFGLPWGRFAVTLKG